ncbi:MAG: RNA polymerase sigma-70 factor [Lewinellaceae bacterium]|nr:RNA polymerase sigma-70 factor [Saprospiraceae bacterium]MCB9341800.1 RNA polymerase sigma-70 factor [Lewinellaceae bacterium]
MINSLTPETELLQLLRQGDDAAFRALYQRFYKYLVVTANNILGDSEAARDLAQDVFVELWKKRESIEVQTSLKPYLRRAVVNKTLNHIKARRIDFTEPEKLPEKPSQLDSPYTQLETSDLEQIIHAAIAALPERCRVIFTLCRLENLPHKEIADQLGISTKTIENQMTRALSALREAIGPHVSPVFLLWLAGHLCLFVFVFVCF